MRPSWIGMGPKPKTSVLRREGGEVHGGDNDVKKEVQMELMQPRAQDHQGPPGSNPSLPPEPGEYTFTLF